MIEQETVEEILRKETVPTAVEESILFVTYLWFLTSSYAANIAVRSFTSTGKCDSHKYSENNISMNKVCGLRQRGTDWSVKVCIFCVQSYSK